MRNLAAGLAMRVSSEARGSPCSSTTASELVVSEWACLVSGLVWVALNVRRRRGAAARSSRLRAVGADRTRRACVSSLEAVRLPPGTARSRGRRTGLDALLARGAWHGGA